MQAIVTKFLPATNIRGSRIKASCERGSITISYPDELSGDACHRAAVDALIAKFVKEDEKRYGTNVNPWQRPYVTGEIPGNLTVHVFGDAPRMVIEFSDLEDWQNAKGYIETAKKTEGTLGGLKSGLLCSALQRSKM